MERPLTPTTKELIFHRILTLQKESEDDRNCAIKMQNDNNSIEFAQFRFLMAEFKENEIEELKQLLFNK